MEEDYLMTPESQYMNINNINSNSSNNSKSNINKKDNHNKKKIQLNKNIFNRENNRNRIDKYDKIELEGISPIMKNNNNVFINFDYNNSNEKRFMNELASSEYNSENSIESKDLIFLNDIIEDNNSNDNSKNNKKSNNSYKEKDKEEDRVVVFIIGNKANNINNLEDNSKTLLHYPFISIKQACPSLTVIINQLKTIANNNSKNNNNNKIFISLPNWITTFMIENYLSIFIKEAFFENNIKTKDYSYYSFVKETILVAEFFANHSLVGFLLKNLVIKNITSQYFSNVYYLNKAFKVLNDTNVNSNLNISLNNDINENNETWFELFYKCLNSVAYDWDALVNMQSFQDCVCCDKNNINDINKNEINNCNSLSCKNNFCGVDRECNLDCYCKCCCFCNHVFIHLYDLDSKLLDEILNKYLEYQYNKSNFNKENTIYSNYVFQNSLILLVLINQKLLSNPSTKELTRYIHYIKQVQVNNNNNDNNNTNSNDILLLQSSSSSSIFLLILRQELTKLYSTQFISEKFSLEEFKNNNSHLEEIFYNSNQGNSHAFKIKINKNLNTNHEQVVHVTNDISVKIIIKSNYSNSYNRVETEKNKVNRPSINVYYEVLNNDFVEDKILPLCVLASYNYIDEMLCSDNNGNIAASEMMKNMKKNELLYPNNCYSVNLINCKANSKSNSNTDGPINIFNYKFVNKETIEVLIDFHFPITTSLLLNYLNSNSNNFKYSKYSNLATQISSLPISIVEIFFLNSNTVNKSFLFKTLIEIIKKTNTLDSESNNHIKESILSLITSSDNISKSLINNINDTNNKINYYNNKANSYLDSITQNNSNTVLNNCNLCLYAVNKNKSIQYQTIIKKNKFCISCFIIKSLENKSKCTNQNKQSNNVHINDYIDISVLSEFVIECSEFYSGNISIQKLILNEASISISNISNISKTVIKDYKDSNNWNDELNKKQILNIINSVFNINNKLSQFVINNLLCERNRLVDKLKRLFISKDSNDSNDNTNSFNNDQRDYVEKNEINDSISNNDSYINIQINDNSKNIDLIDIIRNVDTEEAIRFEQESNALENKEKTIIQANKDKKTYKTNKDLDKINNKSIDKGIKNKNNINDENTNTSPTKTKPILKLNNRLITIRNESSININKISDKQANLLNQSKSQNNIKINNKTSNINKTTNVSKNENKDNNGNTKKTKLPNVVIKHKKQSSIVEDLKNNDSMFLSKYNLHRKKEINNIVIKSSINNCNSYRNSNSNINKRKNISNTNDLVNRCNEKRDLNISFDKNNTRSYNTTNNLKKSNKCNNKYGYDVTKPSNFLHYNQVIYNINIQNSSFTSNHSNKISNNNTNNNCSSNYQNYNIENPKYRNNNSNINDNNKEEFNNKLKYRTSSMNLNKKSTNISNNINSNNNNLNINRKETADISESNSNIILNNDNYQKFNNKKVNLKQKNLVIKVNKENKENKIIEDNNPSYNYITSNNNTIANNNNCLKYSNSSSTLNHYSPNISINNNNENYNNNDNYYKPNNNNSANDNMKKSRKVLNMRNNKMLRENKDINNDYFSSSIYNTRSKSKSASKSKPKPKLISLISHSNNKNDKNLSLSKNKLKEYSIRHGNINNKAIISNINNINSNLSYSLIDDIKKTRLNEKGEDDSSNNTRNNHINNHESIQEYYYQESQIIKSINNNNNNVNAIKSTKDNSNMTNSAKNFYVLSSKSGNN